MEYPASDVAEIHTPARTSDDRLCGCIATIQCRANEYPERETTPDQDQQPVLCKQAMTSPNIQ
jgi:hypothetical protein